MAVDRASDSEHCVALTAADLELIAGEAGRTRREIFGPQMGRRRDDAPPDHPTAS